MLIRFIKVVLAIFSLTIMPYYIGRLHPLFRGHRIVDIWAIGMLYTLGSFILVMLIRSIYMYIVYDGK